VLFAGTIRSNLDPFNEFTDRQLWEACTSVQLEQTLKDLPDKMDSSVQEGKILCNKIYGFLHSNKLDKISVLARDN
jgi:hypothetical protein